MANAISIQETHAKQAASVAHANQMERTYRGTFKKKLALWDGSNWNDGWIDNRGRFRVWRPDCPRAFKAGYALRAHVVWWLAHGECHPEGTALHHQNEIKTDDRLENLEVIEHGEHTRMHHSIASVEFTCEKCFSKFYVKRQRFSDGRKIRLCSQKCYHSFPRNESHKKKISSGLKTAYKIGLR